MELREHLTRTDSLARLKFSAFLSILLHASIFIGGGLLMADQAEYGVAGILPNGGQPRRAQRPVLEMVEFIPEFSDSPVERHEKRKTQAKPVVPVEAGQSSSGGAYDLPSYYRNPPPPYPEEARSLKEEGTVTIRVEVNAQGKAVSVSIVKSAGFSALDLAALEAVKTWQFKPARIAGIPISTSVKIPVNFRLQDAR
jgi:protein TonB